MELPQKLYSIFDKKSGIWDPPFAAPTHGTAERTFARIIANKDTMVSQYPEDFSLWHIGNYDPNTGKIEQTHQQSLGEAVTFLQAKGQN